jgi:hypothetical protein
MPSSLKGHSDCMSVIIRLNDAILTFHDVKLSVAPGALITGGYKFWAVKQQDTKDKTAKRLYPGELRLISWLRPHSEKDDRATNSDEMAKGIFILSTVAALEYATAKTQDSTKFFSIQVDTLKLKNIMNKTIPENQLHFRAPGDLNFPILDNQADYQHQMH